MSQIKKKFLSFLLLLDTFIILNVSNIMAQEIKVRNQSDVVDQKSIIEEQVIAPEAGVAKIWNSDFTIQDLLEINIVEFQKEQEKSPYAETINSLSEEDKELICRITYREAGNQPIKGQRAVMEVILNRLQSDNWPNDIKTILSAPGQFSTWKARNKVTQEQIEEMQEVLLLVAIHNTQVLPSEEYVYFNCSNPNKESIKIKGHWFWV